MKKYRVCIKADGYVEYCIEAENKEEAQKIAVDRIDWGDVELTCGVYEEKQDNSHKRCKVRGEN